MTTKYLRELDKLAANYGFKRVRGGGNSHPTYRNRLGDQVTSSSSPSDRRSLLNFRSVLRRIPS